MNKLYRKTVAEIDLSALKFNVSQLQKRVGPDVVIMAIIKANAYGHGDIQIAKALEKLKVPFLGVAYLEEGIRIREKGVKTPLVILSGGQDPKNFQVLRNYRLTPVIYDLDYLTAYNQFCKTKGIKGKVHLKFDTGMNRLGFSKCVTHQVLMKLKSLRNIKYEGMMTHIANAERPSHFNREQIKNFREIKKSSPIKFKYYHIANSGSILNNFGANENMVRPGLTLYGGYPTAKLRNKLKLKPVMTLKSEIIQLKKVKRGDYVSYGYTYRFKDDTTIATIPVGYADGFLRYYSNKGAVLIRGKRAPVVGVVCMDVFMVDVGHIRGVSLGDRVVLMGRQKRDQITAEELADRIQTIPWEIFCTVSDRVPRTYIK